MALWHPLWGNGPGTFDIALPRVINMHLFSLYAHSSWLQWLAEMGLFGIVGILTILWHVFREQKDPFLKAGLIAVLCHNVVDYSMLVPAQALLFWFMTSYSSSPTVSKLPPHHPLLRRRVLLSLVCILATWHVINRFQSDLHYTTAVRFAYQKNWLQVHKEIDRSIDLNPLAAKPYALLATVDMLSAASPLSKETTQVALIHILSALDHEPIQLAYWAQALMLCDKLGAPKVAQVLIARLSHMYPFLMDDLKNTTLYR